MFNIAPTEILIICVVALIVIGPDKLPGAIKTGTLWLNQFRRSFYKIKSDIERELNTDEIRRQIHNEGVLDEIEDTKQRLQSSADEAKASINELVSSVDLDPGASSATNFKTDADSVDETSESTAPSQPSYSKGVNLKAQSAKAPVIRQSPKEKKLDDSNPYTEIRPQVTGTTQNDVG